MAVDQWTDYLQSVLGSTDFICVKFERFGERERLFLLTVEYTPTGYRWSTTGDSTTDAEINRAIPDWLGHVLTGAKRQALITKAKSDTHER